MKGGSRMSKKLLENLANYPEMEGARTILLAEGIAILVLSQCKMIFFDESIIEPIEGCSGCENISTISRVSVYSLVKADERDSWALLEDAEWEAKNYLRRKDGKEIKWLR